MTKKYNAFANVMLILVAVNTIISFPLYFIGIFRVFGDMDLMSFENWYGDRMPLIIFITVFRIVLSFAELMIWGMWIYFIARNKASIRVPIMVTFIYYVADIAYFIINTKALEGDLLQTIRQQLSAIFIIVAWMVLVLKDDATHRIVFTIIRSLVLGISLIMNVYHIVGVVIDRIKFGSVLYSTDYLNFAYIFLRAFAIALFIIWMFNPKVFLRPSGQEEIK